MNISFSLIMFPGIALALGGSALYSYLKMRKGQRLGTEALQQIFALHGVLAFSQAIYTVAVILQAKVA